MSKVGVAVAQADPPIGHRQQVNILVGGDRGPVSPSDPVDPEPGDAPVWRERTQQLVQSTGRMVYLSYQLVQSTGRLVYLSYQLVQSAGRLVYLSILPVGTVHW